MTFDPANCEPGIYPALTYEQFDAIDAVRPTYVQKWMQTCPAEVKWDMDHDTSTPATVFGQAFHTMMLEPELFNDKFAIWSGTNRTTKAGKAEWAEFQDEVGDKAIIMPVKKSMPDPKATLDGMAAALMSHERAAPLVTDGQAEVTIVWLDKSTKIPCKTRIDYIHGRTVIDLKSILDPNANSVMRAASNKWWRIQAAMAWDGLVAVKCLPEQYIYIAVGKHEPWLVNVLQAQWNYLESGRSAYHYSLPSIDKSKRTGLWPGHAHFDLEEVDLAPWDS